MRDAARPLRVRLRIGSPGLRRWLLAAAGLTAAGCAGARATPAVPPRNSGDVAAAAARESALDVPYRLLFQWSIIEPESRVGGGGVARIQPPARARLDLFASNGERVAAAALDGDELRVAGNTQTEVPSPVLLWGSLGIFRPGGTSLAGGRQFPDGTIELRYTEGDARELRYTLRGDRIERIDVLRGGRSSEEVALVRVDGERFPRRATYRQHEEVRELRITLESVEHVESYPTDIWTLGF